MGLQQNVYEHQRAGLPALQRIMGRIKFNSLADIPLLCQAFKQ
jgi:hypothetical protein